MVNYHCALDTYSELQAMDPLPLTYAFILVADLHSFLLERSRLQNEKGFSDRIRRAGGCFMLSTDSCLLAKPFCLQVVQDVLETVSDGSVLLIDCSLEQSLLQELSPGATSSAFKSRIELVSCYDMSHLITTLKERTTRSTEKDLPFVSCRLLLSREDSNFHLASDSDVYSLTRRFILSSHPIDTVLCLPTTEVHSSRL